ncbi:hypothetical protein Xbed_01693 [Xenorhabdus beddingii]|uniref:Uncharacterized protein n=1 Tax=Xenorhabdus beddingii TaxID=40578 RepID=A0A1Y2SQ70_9GAMM|nr:hypothetical protein [Xenorhabdus beddingii]OTA20218.1 hypothetical protein Xbed_01693 [Xenorhabdus beddingii]
MRFTDDKQIRKSIIRLFTYTEQIIMLKSFALVKNETRDDFTHWIRGLAYEFIDSVKTVTIFFIILLGSYFWIMWKSQIYSSAVNYVPLVYFAFCFFSILNKARIIGCGYIVGLKFFLFCINNKIFFKPKTLNKAYPPFNTQGIKVYIGDDEKTKKLITKIFTFKEQLTLLRLFSVERERTNGDFLAWLIKTADDDFSATRMMLIVFFIVLSITLIQQPDGWYYILITFFIFLMPLIILICMFASSHLHGCSFMTSVKLLYFHIKNKANTIK